MDLLSSILLDEELTSYLQFMVEEGCELNNQIQLDLERYRKESITKDILFNNLEAEWRFQKDRGGV